MSSSTKKDKGKGLLHTVNDQLTKTQSSVTQKHLPLDPFLFYIRDHELYYTALNGPRYNEYAIFIYFHELYLSTNSSSTPQNY